MGNPFIDQKRFMQACDQSVSVYDPAQFDLYVNLMREEWDELNTAIAEEDKVETLDALIDFIVVTVGAIHSMGADAQGAWDEVMRTNFAKVDPQTGKVRKREDGKVLKPDNWQAPNLSPFVSKTL
jgi:predicted HAD superfamily Cof-like phosphohydrolase